MSDDTTNQPENVVFLTQYRHAKTQAKGQGGGEIRHLSSSSQGPKAGSNPIQLEGTSTSRSQQPLKGTLYWLHCPTCNTLEYTEAGEPNPRMHRPCSTQVQIAPVELDLRAEASVANANLERIDALATLLESARQQQLEYLNRLSLAANQHIEPYADLEEKSPAALNVAGVDALGLRQSRFFKEAKTHFAPKNTNPTDHTNKNATAATSDEPPYPQK